MTIDANASSPASINITPPSRWACVLLGIVMIVAGFLVLGDIALFTVVSAIFFGWMAIAVGLFEIVHAFWIKGWGGFFGRYSSASSTSPSELRLSHSR